jgi:hypothetical protein
MNLTKLKKNLMLAALAVSSAVGSVAIADAAYETPTVGGNGGNEFTAKCGTGFLKGLTLRSGRVIDRVGMRCVNGRNEVIDYGVSYGGWGGNAGSTTCRAGKVVKGLQLRGARLVDAVALFCIDEWQVAPAAVPSDETIDWSYPWFGGNGGEYASVSCDWGDAAVGIRGSYGDRVDRLGLWCRDVPN